MINVTLWNEDAGKNGAYPDGINEALAEIFTGQEFKVVKANLEQPEQGLSDEILNNTDVLIWWGHRFHDKVDDALVDKVVSRVNDGMGFIALHSAHYAKPFKKLMGTHCSLRHRTTPFDKEILWTVVPSHPIAQGVPQGYKIGKEEMYGEYFDIPEPDSVVFIGWFNGGEVFRSGCTFTRGKGRIFYFQPGHETYPIYRDKVIQRIIYNATMWAAYKELENTFRASGDAPRTRFAKWSKTNEQK